MSKFLIPGAARTPQQGAQNQIPASGIRSGRQLLRGPVEGRVTSDDQQTPPQSTVDEGSGEVSGDSVPKDAFLQRITRLSKSKQKAESRIQELEAENERLRKASQPTSEDLTRQLLKAERPEGWDTMTEDEKFAYIAVKALELAPKTENESPEIARMKRDVENIRYFSNLTEEQLEAVDEIRDTYPDITDPQKILRLAIVEFSDLFGKAAAFEATTPGRGSSSERARSDDSDTERMQQLAALDPLNPNRRGLGRLLVRKQIEQAALGQR